MFIGFVLTVTGFIASSCSVIEPEPAETKPEIFSGLPEVKREFRAAWIATVANIDWPSRPGLSVKEQQMEMIQLLNRAKALNMNAVILQVRPAADAIYDSPYEPWASYLTGEMGRAPLPVYDPLEFAIREAHKRGLELHAWFNPFRAGHPADHSEVSPDHISQTNPELVHRYGNFHWLDPGLPEAQEHSRKVIMDVVNRYDIDGVHFDDYFYPYRSYANGEEFPDDISWKQALERGTVLNRNDWRRNNVDQFIKQIYQDIKSVKPHVKFGISPFGIWQPGFPRRTTGFNAHEELYADARRWLQNGWLDYISPQIYYRTDQIGQPFPVILQWWAEQNHHGRHIWPGLYTSRLVTPDITWTGDEIQRQLYILRGFPGINGAIHFSMQAIMRNPDRFRDLLSAGPYAEQALVPSTPWISNQNPSAPAISVENFEDYISIQIIPKAENIRHYVIRSKNNETWDIDIIPASVTNYTITENEYIRLPEKIYITAVNNLGNESTASEVQFSDTLISTPRLNKNSLPNFINRQDWSNQIPGGYIANGTRRNLSHNDTLYFRDLSIIISTIQPASPMAISGSSESGQNNGQNSNQPGSVMLTLNRNGVSEKLTATAGSSFNWYGYHVGILEFRPHLPPAESGAIEIEIATVQSLPVDRAAILETGNSNQRIRVPHQIQKITIHHTGSAEPLKPDEDSIENVQNLLSWSRESRNWWDLPYHYLVDLDGNIYEGRDTRFAGDINGNYDPAGHLKIAVIGNYNLQEPSERQISSIRTLISWAVASFNISPDKIYGQDDWTNTTGPGIHIRSLIDEGVFSIQISD